MSLRRKARVAAAETELWQRAQRAGRRYAVVGAVLGLLAGGLLFAPAQWLADGLQQASNGRLLLAEARGSLWSGSAVLVLTGGPGSLDASALPGRLAWQLRPHWQGLRLLARQDCCLNGELQLLLQPGWGGYSLVLGQPQPQPQPVTAGGKPAASLDAPLVAPLVGHWPAAWLAGLGTPWNTLQLGGVLQLSSTGFTVQSVEGRVRLLGALALELRGVSSRVSTLPTLGSYRLSLQGPGAAGEAAALQLLTLDGALRLSGSGQWAGAKLRFRGQAQAAEGQAPALQNLLNIIGRRQGALSVISIG